MLRGSALGRGATSSSTGEVLTDIQSCRAQIGRLVHQEAAADVDGGSADEGSVLAG